MRKLRKITNLSWVIIGVAIMLTILITFNALNAHFGWVEILPF
jgi:hypothetical protein